METGECVLFLGAGIGYNLVNDAGENAPSAIQLARDLAKDVGLEPDSITDLSKVAKIVEIRKGRTHLETFLRRRLSNFKPDDAFKWLFTRRWRAVFTTNYDSSIETAYNLLTEPVQIPRIVRLTKDLANYDLRIDVPIFYLHGTVHDAHNSPIVITKDDYTEFSASRKQIFSILKSEFATSTVLYIGYSNKDPNWELVLSEITSEFGASRMPRAYRIAPDTDPLDVEILRNKNIETIDATLDEFHGAASIVLSKSTVDKLERIKSTIPSDLLPSFEKNAAPVARLLSSWTYVNQAPFQVEPNLKDYLDGNKPNWGLIASDMTFSRDLEEEITETLLDYATNPNAKPTVKVVLAPAGYGVTTLLMTLAVKLIKQQAGSVFMLNDAQQVEEGDVDFAASLFDKLPFFIIDNAADNIELINRIVSRYNSEKRPILFLLGARLNEWRQANRATLGTEFQIEPLSDPEINRLLAYLEEFSKLNRLAELDPEMRFSVIKNKHQQELLVAMKEATEGRSFDAIIEDEFRGIANPVAQRLYLIVCGFYQYGTYIRTGLLSSMLQIAEAQLYEELKGSVEGIVVYKTLNESRGLYVARARHRTIAGIVWERCGLLGDRENILQSAIEALNLNYGVDKAAFEDFVRSDRMISDIGTLEGRIRFFDKACRIDPKSPYVRQHYARMFLRSDKPDSALRLINEAIQLDPSVRVLHHTRAHILKELALTSTSDEIARRFLVQSEDGYRQAINMYQRDEYSYQGLAELYFGWARRGDAVGEQSEYLSRAEQVISTGLTQVTNRSGLWIVSSEIQNWLGDHPSRIQSLEKAVQQSPNSIVPRYLLGRAYRKMNEFTKAMEVLRPVIQHDFEEFRCFVEYALSQIYAGQSYSEAISVLSQSRTYGLRDPRYIATLGGMCFMNRKNDEANSIFRETDRRNFSPQDKNTIQFQPPNPNDLSLPLRIVGTVSSVQGRYCFIQPQDYAAFFCPGSKYNGISMKVGLRLSFEPSFTAKGSLANDPTLIEP